MKHDSAIRPVRPRPDWETPDCEQIRVSAEATAYMGVREDWD